MSTNTHARRILAQCIEAIEDPDLPPDLRERHRDRARDLVDGAVDDTPVSVVKVWRGGDLLSVQYLDGPDRGDVAFVDPEAVDEWTPAADGDPR